MGGKRPDQHNIAPGEAGATDYKTMPQTGKGRDAGDDPTHLDRQRVAQSEKEAEEGQPFPARKPAPSVHANAGKKEHVENTGGPKLPANAHGVDMFTAEEQDQGIDDESMYDNRPSQDKDRPPSEE